MCHLLETAVTVFGRMGYRRAQIADIAREMGVAPGTVYLYVESKEALFDQALQFACHRFAPEKMGSLPIPTPTAGEILERVRLEFAGPGFLIKIREAMDSTSHTDICAEFTDLIAELYSQVHQRHRALAMIEASALDWPELFALFYGIRHAVLESLTEYLTRRIHEGRLRSVPDPTATARLILETISWFAYHRSGDPEPDGISEETSRATVLDALTHAYLPTEPGV
jgi:AcrR family transcriptional regulator